MTRKEYNHRYYMKHREELLKRMKTYQTENDTKIRAYRRRRQLQPDEYADSVIEFIKRREEQIW